VHVWKPTANKIYVSPTPSTNIRHDAFIYARWRHRLAWLLPFEWPNADTLKGVPKFDALVRRISWTQGGEFKLVKTTFNAESFICRLFHCRAISAQFALEMVEMCVAVKSRKHIHKNLYFGVQGHTRFSVPMKSQCMTSY